MSSSEELARYPERTLLLYLEDPVMVISAKGKVVYLNPAFRRRFKVDREKAAGQPLSALVPEWLWRPLLGKMAELEPGASSRHFWISSERERFRVSMSGITLQERVAGATVAIWDATREIEMGRRKMDLFRIMMNDLEYPLQEIKALAVRPEPMSESRKKSVQEQTEQLEEVLGRFRDFGELFLGDIKSELVAFSPGRLLTLSRKSLQPVAEAKGVILEEGSSRDLPRILGDPALLNRVLGLVVDYMIRAVPDRELVVLSVDLNLMKDGASRLSYSITGTGIMGLEAEWVIRDDPLPMDFIALNDEKKRLLFRVLLAHRLVQAMGGTIALAAHELVGTTFTLSVPAQIFFGASA